MVCAYWWKQIPNIGDRLTPLLLSHFTDSVPVWAPVSAAEVVVIGSALEHIPAGWDGHILGTGRIREDSELHLKDARIHALRGPLSAKGVSGDYALGDAGLLANELVDVQTRDISVGVMPHWSDTDLVNWQWVQRLNPVIISPWDDPLSVISLIGRCKKLVTSSLHGVILADAFGIPRRTEIARRFTEDPREGNLFKFKDYNASVGLPAVFGELQSPKTGAVTDRKAEIWDAFNELGQQL
jgi:pyruvyltransferase